jgi:hypothetical protein
MIEVWVVGFWQWIAAFVNTNFGAALVSASIGSAAGAWGGAFAIQRIAERTRRRNVLIDEIRGCNAGIDAAGAILNAFLNFKGGNLVELKRSYDEQRGAVEVQRLGVQGGWIQGRLDVRVDQGSLPSIRVPVERLQTVMHEQIVLTGRAQGLANKVVQVVDLANDTIKEREKVIEELKRHPED